MVLEAADPPQPLAAGDGEDDAEEQEPHERRAYAAVDRIDWPQGFCRRDIGWRAIARENA